MARWILTLALLMTVCEPDSAISQTISFERIRDAAEEPQNWLTYSGSYNGSRYTSLAQITPANVAHLELKWIYQGAAMGPWESTPLVIDGIMYVTQRPNDIVALDAKSGRVYWIYRWPTNPEQRACCGANNRGVAALGDAVFMGTLDGYLVAVDARTGKALWNTKVGDMEASYSITTAPLVIKNMVLVGVSGGENGIRGYIVAIDAKTGKERWRFYTVPGPGEPGHETWAGDSWKHGGAPVWVTGTYDPELNMTYWGTGNPGPDYNPEQRRGDNLYSDSAVALDADTGRLKWYFQFTPSDSYDYDSTQIPVLVDDEWQGVKRKLIFWGNRNGFFYVLDRTDGEFLRGNPFVKVNWARGELDQKTGRPTYTRQPDGQATYPGAMGATNWYSPSYSPLTRLFYLSAWEDGAIFKPEPEEYRQGHPFMGGIWSPYLPVPDALTMPLQTRGPINNWTDAVGHGAIIALDPFTGNRKWTYNMFDVTLSGILTTASNVLFSGGREGYFEALDTRTGKLLWKMNLGGNVISGPISYRVGNTQYISVISGMSLATFALP